jgi:integrase
MNLEDNTMARIEKRNDTTYSITVCAGYDISGKQLRKKRNFRIPDDVRTQRQLTKWLKEQEVLFEQDVKGGLYFSGTTRFADYADKWMSLNEKVLAPKTYERYLVLLQRINAAVGHIRLDKLQAHHLETFYDALTKTGTNKHTGGGLSEKTIIHHHRLIGVVLADAYKKGYTLRNVATLATTPKLKKHEINYLDETDVEKLFAALDGKPMKMRCSILMLLYLGIRKGELCGLEWRDVDFEGGTIAIRRTVQYVTGKKYEYTDKCGVLRKGQIIEKEPKTASSNRVISVDGGVLQLLSDYRDYWLLQREQYGGKWIETDKIFFAENSGGFGKRDGSAGGTMHPDTVNNYITRLIKEHDLPPFTPHGLRHTNISLMIANQIDIKTVSSRAGHASVVTTLNQYTHQIKSRDALAAQKLGDVFARINAPALCLVEARAAV